MISSKTNPQTGIASLRSDKLAAMVATKIISSQNLLSGSLNRWINRYSTKKKISLLITIGIVFFILLGTSTFFSFYTVPKLTQNFTSSHIGMASEVPGPKNNAIQLTDSLTIKK